MKFRFVMLMIALATFSGSVGVAVWFWMEPLGRGFALGMVPFALAGCWFTVYWLHRILATRELYPGLCECGHLRCCHVNGAGECDISFGISEAFPKGSSCACDIFIPKTSEPKTLSSKQDEEVQKLKKMAGL